MDEILPGLHHWTTHHDGIGQLVSSYLVEPAGIVVDPLLPDGGVEEIGGITQPQQVVLTTGLHLRDAREVAEAFDIPIRASAAALDRLGDDVDIRPFEDSARVAPGVEAIAVDALAPDEAVLHIALGEHAALAFPDTVMNYGDALSYVPDGLMGDDPEAVKAKLTAALRALLQRDFDTLLFAHGDPVVGNGKDVLRTFVDAQ